MNDVRKYIYTPIVLLLIGTVVWVGFLFTNACGYDLSCNKGMPAVARTPIPTMIPAKMPAGDMHVQGADMSGKCMVAAADLLGAWVNAGAPESDAFEFTAADGAACTGTFADVQPLFSEPNLWSAGARSCVSCHSADFISSKAKLDLTSYAGVMAGSQRADAASKGNSILGGGWESSLLHQFMEAKAGVAGHETATENPLVYAGTPLPVATPTP